MQEMIRQFSGMNVTIGKAGYAEVIANEIASTDFIDTEVDSKRFGVMWHQNQGGLLHLKGSKFRTGKAAFLVEGCYPEILVEESEINTGDGVILQLMESDDPGLGPKEVVVDTAVPVKVEDHDVSKVNFHDGYMYNKPAYNLCTDVRATFRNMSMNGNLLIKNTFIPYSNTVHTGIVQSWAIIQFAAVDQSRMHPEAHNDSSTNRSSKTTSSNAAQFR